MFNTHEMETMARIQREEIARQVAAIHRADEATRNRTAPRAWRWRMAAAMRAAATWIAPATTEPAADPEPRIT